MAAASVCGASYAHLLVTETGATPSNPWSWYPAGPLDYDGWRHVAYKIMREVFRKWVYLLSTEAKLAQMDDPPVAGVYPERSQLLLLLEEFDAEVQKIPRLLVELSSAERWAWEPAIRQAISAGRDGTCVLELIDRAMAFYEAAPLPMTQSSASEDTNKPRSSGGALVTLALGGVGFYFWRKHRRKS